MCVKEREGMRGAEGDDVEGGMGRGGTARRREGQQGWGGGRGKQSGEERARERE